MKNNIIATALLTLSFGANAYDEDGHYYAAALMALDINGGQPLPKDLLTIVRSIQFVDDNPLTEPNGNGVENRRTRHFPVADRNDVTKRDSAFARHNVNKALSENDPYWLGMALHTYLDSYAHEGYDPIIGQAPGGYDADRPHLATDKFRQMSEMVYTILQKWQSNNNRSSLNTLQSAKYKELASFIPDGYSCAGLLNGTLGALSTKDGCRDYSQQVAEIAPRIKWWYSNTSSIFPDSYLPAYSRLSGDDLTKFDGIIQVYKMPTSEAEADNRTWAGITSTASRVAVRSAFVSTKATAEPTTSNMTIKDLAKFSIENAANYIDGMDPRLINEEGFIALLNAANKTRGGWSSLAKLSAQGDAKGLYAISSRVRARLISNIKSANIEKRFFALRALQAGHQGALKLAVEKNICNSANAAYKSLKGINLNNDQMGAVLSSISTDSTWMVDCGAGAISFLEGLIGHPVYGSAVAARHYQLVADEERVNGLQFSEKQKNTVAALRNSLSDSLWGVAFEGRSPTVSNGTQLHELQYWAIRSREDFDDNAHGSAQDIKHLLEMDNALTSAMQKDDLELMSAALTSIATYDPTDNPSKSLIANINNVLSNEKYATQHLLAGYALQQVTGQKLDLTVFLK